MDRNTIIAVILCTIVISVGMTIQTTFFAPEVTTEVTNAATVESVADSSSVSASKGVSFRATGRDGPVDPFNVVSDSLDITFNPVGGTISSIKTVQHMENGKPVELLFKEEGDINAFMLYYGNDKTQPIDDVFNYTVSQKSASGDRGELTQVTFTRDFETETGDVFTIEKSYAVPMNDEYMIQLAVTVKTADGKSIPIGSENGMYSLSVGPQIGPSFTSLSGNYDYRRVIYKLEDSNSKKNASFDKNGLFEYSKKPVDWVGLTGKYFAFLLIPETDSITASISAEQITKDEGITQKDTFYVTRAASNSSSVTDIYSFYSGPQVSKSLGIYDVSTDNIFGLSNHNLKKALDVSWLSWLETGLKWVLELFYYLIPNYGIAIILLTILVKIILIPISKKGLDSTAKMSALTPKIEEIKAKYPDNQEAQNAAMTKLYQEEKINPMGSCLPMLIQFPIFIALYGLLNKNFDLRGAMFIPGWIPDLSLPDCIYTLPFNIPLLGSEIHLLPFIYTVSMIYSMKITQTANTAQSQKGMMMFMTYGMPIMFFFVMYNAPAGLLVYWTITNFISIGQQMWTNKKKAKGYSDEIKAKDAEKEAKKAAKKKRR